MYRIKPDKKRMRLHAVSACVLFCLYIFGTLGVSVLHALDHDCHVEICSSSGDSCCGSDVTVTNFDEEIDIPVSRQDSKISHSCLLCHIHLQFDQIYEYTYTGESADLFIRQLEFPESVVYVFEVFANNFSRGPPFNILA